MNRGEYITTVCSSVKSQNIKKRLVAVSAAKGDNNTVGWNTYENSIFQVFFSISADEKHFWLGRQC